MKRTAVSAILFLAFSGVLLPAAEPGDPALQQILKDALVLHMQTRIFHDARKVMWESELDKLTIPGRAVTVTMRNRQARLKVHFTPYRQGEGRIVLVAQSEIWLIEGKEGRAFRYFSSMKSIPVNYENLIYFYPLGKLENQEDPDQLHIEMELCVLPYNGSAGAAGSAGAGDREELQGEPRDS